MLSIRIFLWIKSWGSLYVSFGFESIEALLLLSEEHLEMHE